MLRNKSYPMVLSVALLLLWASLSWSQTEKPKPEIAPDALPGVEPEMLTPGYWASLHDDVDEVIMTPEEIIQFNERIRNRKTESTRYEGPLRNPVLPLDFPDTLPGSTLRIWLESNVEKLFSPPDLYGSRDFYDDRNAIYNDSMKQALLTG